MSILQAIISFIVMMGFVFGIIGLMFYHPKPKGYMAEMDCKAHNEKLLKKLEDLKGETTMSQRMNKERAREIHKTLKDYFEKYFVNEERSYLGEELTNEEIIQALDIAIKSLEQEKNIEDCIVELQAFELTLKDLTEVGRIDESTFNTFSKIIKQIIERLEPYERKEQVC